MNILITGGNGYIGSRLGVRMTQEGWQLTLLDTSFPEICDQKNRRVRQIGLDAADPLCEKIFADSKYDAVVHLACARFSTGDDKDCAETLHHNIQSLDNILHLSRKSHVGKVIVLFDYRIYGEGADNLKTEAADLAPDTEIGRQEILRDQICRSYSRQGLEVVRMRTGQVYGPSISFCPDAFALQQRLLAELPSVYASEMDASDSVQALRPDSDFFNSYFLDFIFINDLIEAIIRTCESATSSLLNIGTGTPVAFARFRQLNRYYWQLYQARKTGERQPLGSFPADTPQTQKRGYCLDYTRASMELDWSPRFNLEEGIARTVSFLSSSHDHVEGSRTSDSAVEHFGIHMPGILQQYKPRVRKAALRTGINLVLFAITISLIYLFTPGFATDIDMLVPYIVLISILYGSQEGYFAALMAICARLWVNFAIYDISLGAFLQDIREPMLLGYYFLLSFVICYVADRFRQRSADLQQQITELKSERDFLNELYRNSLQVKETLQRTISETQQSFSRIQYIIRQLNDASPADIGDISVKIVSEILSTPSVSLYQADRSGNYLLRIAGACSMLPEKLDLSNQQLILETLSRQKITVNTHLEPSCPLICAPVPSDESICSLILFLDGIELMQLNQNYLNTLNSLVQLIGYYARPQLSIVQT